MKPRAFARVMTIAFACVTAVYLLTGCKALGPEARRESMVDMCIRNSGKPLECAQAARITIPD